jgi:DNA-binding CsgD family transcriptional regulator
MSYSLGLLAEGDAAADEALRAADALRLDSAWSDTVVSRVRARGDVDPDEVRAGLEEALERARRSGDIDVEMRVLYNCATVAFEDGRVDEAVSWCRRAVQRARDLGVEWAFYPTELRHLGVTALYVAGEWDASLAEADVLSRVPDMSAHVRAAGLLVLVGRGDPVAHERVAEARALVPRLKEHVLLALVTATAEIDLAAWDDDPATAASVAEETARRLREQWEGDHLAVVRLVGCALAPVADAAGAARRTGNTKVAEHWVGVGESLVETARSAVDVFAQNVGEMGVEGKAWLARAEAEDTRLHGRTAPELWHKAVDAFGFGHVYEQARSRRRLAEALMEGDDRAGASEQARLALEVAVRLGAAPLRTAVESLIRRGRLDVPLAGGRAVDPSAVLTPREADVLVLLARGRTNRQIGAELYISEKTASVHVSNILAKLGANGRAEAVAIAAQRGLLPTAS